MKFWCKVNAYLLFNHYASILEQVSDLKFVCMKFHYRYGSDCLSIKP